MHSGIEHRCQKVVIIKETEADFNRSQGFLSGSESSEQQVLHDSSDGKQPLESKDNTHVYRCAMSAVVEWGNDVRLFGCEYHAPVEILEALDIPVPDARQSSDRVPV